MSAQGPGWLDEPEHDEPVDLAQAVSEWASAQPGTSLHGGSATYGDTEAEQERDEHEGGMSEYRHYADWQDVVRAEYEREASG